MKGSLQVNELEWLWHDGKDGLLKIVHSSWDEWDCVRFFL